MTTEGMADNITMIRERRFPLADQGKRNPCMTQGSQETARPDHACSCRQAGLIDCLERHVMAVGKPVARMTQAGRANKVVGSTYQAGLRLRINNPYDNGCSIVDIDVLRYCAASVMDSLSDSVGNVDEVVRYTGPARYREAVYSEGAGLRRLVEGSTRRWATVREG